MTEYEKLKLLYAQADTLIASRVDHFHETFKVWRNNTERLIAKHYGTDSFDYKQFQRIRFAPQVHGIGDHAALIKECKAGLEITKEMLKEYLDEGEDDSMQNKNFNNKQAFIVHGHDDQLKIQVARLLEQQGIEAIILHEQPNAGKTIIEKIEHFSDVGAAIILFTPDDSGKANRETDYQPRARQNVVFEAGYFMGYLGRDRTVMIVKDANIELPGDLHGVVYTAGSWQYDLIKELREMGFPVDMNKIQC